MPISTITVKPLSDSSRTSATPTKAPIVPPTKMPEPNETGKRFFESVTENFPLRVRDESGQDALQHGLRNCWHSLHHVEQNFLDNDSCLLRYGSLDFVRSFRGAGNHSYS